ncbi:MAG: hypothetical protein ABSC19_02405 [Syntrophorhabdales bacterium]
MARNDKVSPSGVTQGTTRDPGGEDCDPDMAADKSLKKKVRR